MPGNLKQRNARTRQWGMDGGIEPWNAGMIPVPASSVGLLLLFGAMGLTGLSALKAGA